METVVRSRAGAGLIPKQQRFVEEYLVDLCATRAAIRAGYSARNADKIGPRLVGKSRVSTAIAEARRRVSDRAEVTAAWVLARLKENGRDTILAAGEQEERPVTEGGHAGLFDVVNR